jgi:DNA polymerase-3 subunit beta
MDITLNRDTLADKLSEIIGIASRKTTIAALGGVLINAQKGEATFSATDMEISARVAGQAQVTQAGSALLPAKRLGDIVKLLPPDQSLRIASDGASAVRIECGRYNSKLQTFSADDFPPFPTPTKDVPVMKVAGETLTSLIRKVQHAVMTATDVRYFLSGACMILAGNRLTLVATDGRRLAIASAARPNGPEAKVLITHQMLGELTAMFEHVDEAIAFSVDGNHVRFSCGPRLLISTIVDGQFPAFDRVIPKDNDKSVVVERDDLAQALRRVSLATTDGTRSVLFNVEKGGVRLTASSADVGEAVEHVDGSVKGGAVTVRLPSSPVLDFLSAAEAGKIAIELRDGTSAAILRQLDESDTNYRCVVMPIVQ